LLLVCLGGRPTPTTRQVSSGGLPPQSSTRPGTTSGEGRSDRATPLLRFAYCSKADGDRACRRITGSSRSVFSSYLARRGNSFLIRRHASSRACPWSCSALTVTLRPAISTRHKCSVAIASKRIGPQQPDHQRSGDRVAKWLSQAMVTTLRVRAGAGGLRRRVRSRAGRRISRSRMG